MPRGKGCGKGAKGKGGKGKGGKGKGGKGAAMDVDGGAGYVGYSYDYIGYERSATTLCLQVIWVCSAIS